MKAENVKNIAIIGAGMISPGVAQVFETDVMEGLGPVAGAHAVDLDDDESQLGQRRWFFRDDAQHAARPAMVAERHAPDAAQVLEIADPFGGRAQPERLMAALGHQGQQQRHDVDGRQRRVGREAGGSHLRGPGRPRVSHL